jgi:hypothetical protein
MSLLALCARGRRESEGTHVGRGERGTEGVHVRREHPETSLDGARALEVPLERGQVGVYAFMYADLPSLLVRRTSLAHERASRTCVCRRAASSCATQSCASAAESVLGVAPAAALRIVVDTSAIVEDRERACATSAPWPSATTTAPSRPRKHGRNAARARRGSCWTTRRARWGRMAGLGARLVSLVLTAHSRLSRRERRRHPHFLRLRWRGGRTCTVSRSREPVVLGPREGAACTPAEYM